MTLGIRGKLFLITLALIVPSVVASHLYLRRALDRNLTERIRADVRVRTSLVQVAATGAGLSLEDLAGWDRLADALGQKADARVTFVRADGVVLGDSEVPLERLRRLENHAGRPEVRDALQRGAGESLRKSDTLGTRMAYSAVVLTGPGGETVGVARVALPLAEMDRALGELTRLLLVGTLVALALAVGLAMLGARWMSRQVHQLTEAARQMAQGDLEVRTRASGSDELSELGQTLDQLAASLSATLGELRGERDLLGRILDGLGEGVLLLDDKGRIERLNPALREMLLLETTSAGQSLMEVFRHARLNELLDGARASNGMRSGEIEVSGIKPRTLLVRAAPLPGEPWRLLVIFFDLTDVRRLESMRRDFVANASHELRTPVTAIRSAAETLKGAIAQDPAAATQFANIIERNADRLQRLVQDLLDLSRIESKEFALQLEPVPLSPVADQVLALFRETAARRRVRLVNGISPAIATPRADSRALERVLTNLVDNAVKYTREGAEVAIRAREDAQRVLISVRDNGGGIERRHLPRLFERFYRVDAGRSREVGGTGLGLSIVKNLVEAMEGRISVDSELERGTEFTVSLPRSDR